MAQINWITKAGSLGKIAEEDYFESQLDAYDTEGSPLTYTVIAGKLSGGLQLFKSGLIQGIPIIEATGMIQEEVTATFTIRAKNSKGNIADRTFSITINSIALPQILPKDVSLGTYYDGYYLDLHLHATDPNPSATITWKLLDGELPAGTILTPQGRLFGYLKPYISGGAESLLGWSVIGWDYVSWDLPVASAQSKIYTFSVQVFDGARYDATTYTLNVQAKSAFTADNTYLTVGNPAILVSTDNKHVPYIITQPQDLPPQRQDSNFAFKIDGIDLDGSEIEYAIILSQQAAFDQGFPFPDRVFDEENFGFDQPNQTLPTGITIDPANGWITGHLPAQSETVKTYTFQVSCHKKEQPASISPMVTFTLTILGSMDNAINWISPNYLGQLDNGDISEFKIQAISTQNKSLNYRLKESVQNPDDGNPNESTIRYTPSGAKNMLPQGLKLLPDGLIIGRPTFEYFSMDNGTTTFDKKLTNFDNVYTFTITASDESLQGIYKTVADGFDSNHKVNWVANPDYHAATVAADKTFTIKINNYNAVPYENLYLRALPSKAQREQFTNLLDNTDIFPDQLIYRPNDPWFGKAKDIKFLFAAGLAPNTAATYINSLSNNHYNKRLDLSNVKTAILTDTNYNIQYEIVYVEVSDPLSTAPKSINRSSQVKYPYTLPPYNVVYPNSLANMNAEVTGAIGYANRGALPHWMTHPQEDGRVLGFTQAVILAYTVPGASKLIAYRLSQSQTAFNEIEFVVDRYQLDHTLSKNFNIVSQVFNDSAETTFDRLSPASNIHSYAGSVNYAVRVPFDEINGRTVGYIVDYGGIDGVTKFKDGETLIFAKQELFQNASSSYTKDPYDTNNYDVSSFNLSVLTKAFTSAFDGWNLDTALYGATGYGSSAYASSKIVPGYLEKIMLGVANQRAGIWKINISADKVVTLSFVKEIFANNYIQVAGGQSHGDSKLYYEPQVKTGHSVPEYNLLTNRAVILAKSTIFDGGGTHFINNRDQYTEPAADDVFLKFPKINVYE